MQNCNAIASFKLLHASRTVDIKNYEDIRLKNKSPVVTKQQNSQSSVQI